MVRAPATTENEFIVDFPVLWVALDWIERHCVIPDRHEKGMPYILADWQAWYFQNFYRVKRNAPLPDDMRPAIGAPAFFYRRAQVVMPQKAGKGPMTAAHVCLEAVGPALFAGWAHGGEKYKCIEHGCFCGWVYEYELGEPMGAPWSTPLIQITAYSEEQTGNVYDALRPMIDEGPLSDVITRTGEEFIRLPGGGRIDTVTSSNQSRLGQRVTFVPQDETGIWLKQNKMDRVADTQRRGASGMQGRTAETTNAWDPAENSVAQKTAEAALVRKDIFRLHRLAAAGLRFTNKEDRRRIFRHVYAGSHWIDIDSIEAECAEIMLNDPAQAERFYGNRIVAGLGTYLDEDVWDQATKSRIINNGTPVAVGFDGSDSDDWTALSCTTEDGFSFIPQYGPDKRPTFWNPKEWGGEIPRDEVDAAMDEVFRKYKVRRVYADPHDWESEIDAWIVEYGEEIVVPWATYRIIPMHSALVRFKNDLKSRRATHDPDPVAKAHALRARKGAKPQDRYVLVKPHQHQKIDILMATILGYEAAMDLTVENLWAAPSRLSRVKGRARSY
jgi:hypothetical protein